AHLFPYNLAANYRLHLCLDLHAPPPAGPPRPVPLRAPPDRRAHAPPACLDLCLSTRRRIAASTLQPPGRVVHATPGPPRPRSRRTAASPSTLQAQHRASTLQVPSPPIHPPPPPSSPSQLAASICSASPTVPNLNPIVLSDLPLLFPCAWARWAMTCTRQRAVAAPAPVELLRLVVDCRDIDGWRRRGKPPRSTALARRDFLLLPPCHDARLLGCARPGDSLFFHYNGHSLGLLPPETRQDDHKGFDSTPMSSSCSLKV
uniref:Uncharacterized protein n=3 Tax=Aegilops tauschii subsp. strangulata TaxID=200361 RepID=A0A453GWI9_AEGTS